jgi:hypothetical protein
MASIKECMYVIIMFSWRPRFPKVLTLHRQGIGGRRTRHDRLAALGLTDTLAFRKALIEECAHIVQA